mgnify:CR=1 FL=1
METRRTNKGGRPALADPAKHRHILYLNDRENARFLSQWEQSGVTSKSRFIAARLLGEPFRVVKVDKSAVEYCARLTEFLCSVPGGSGQLQPNCKGVAQQFFREKGTGFSL